MTAKNIDKTIAQLADIFVLTLKEMATKGEKLTPDSFAKNLSGNSKLDDLLSAGAVAEAPRGGADPSALEAAEGRVQKLKSENQSVKNQLLKVESQTTRRNDILMRGLLSTMRLVPTQENPGLGKALEKFRAGLMKGESHLDLEEALSEVKEQILRGDGVMDEGGDAKRPREQSPLWKKLLGRDRDRARGSEADVMDTTLVEDPAAKVRQSWLEFLAEFHQDLGPEYTERLAILEGRVDQAEDLDYLISLRPDISRLLRSFTRAVMSDRKEQAEFIAEVGKRLAGLQGQVSEGSQVAEETEAAQESFNTELSGHIRSVTETAGQAANLEDLRDTVLSRMAHVQEAINEKNLADQVRTHKIKRIMLAMRDEVEAVREEVGRARRENLALQKRLLVDPLTGIFNRRGLEDKLTELLDKYKLQQQPFCLLVIDVDHFKEVNDKFGHSVGDELLREMVKKLKSALKDEALLARLGGDEFVALFPNTKQDNGVSLAETLRRAVESTEFTYRGAAVPITLSLGLAEVGPQDNDAKSLLDRADLALYAAKQAGRNRLEVSQG